MARQTFERGASFAREHVSTVDQTLREAIDELQGVQTTLDARFP